MLLFFSIFDARFDTFQIDFSKNTSHELATQKTHALSYHLYSNFLSHSTKKGIEFLFQL
ncbi:hypothetical protein HOF65_05775 [bacterium]|nr:hypothetical protein [bacterium]MBT3853446.1 hypothetical protein [bacterium]MBT4632739.1 hypothetical protein [bacterium]